MGKRVLLLANKRAGYEVCKFLKAEQDEILRLYVIESGNDCYQETRKVSGLSEDKIFRAGVLKDESHMEDLIHLQADFLITVYWPYLLPSKLFQAMKGGTLNFHPALLPINRGWYPHVHSIIDGSPLGVTLHALEESADTGPIWAQKEVFLCATDTAKSIHERLQDEIIGLFKSTWPKIKKGEITPVPQDESKANYHAKEDVSALDEIDLQKAYKAADLINLLKARSFGDKGFAYFKDSGKKVYLNLRLSEQNDFSGGGA